MWIFNFLKRNKPTAAAPVSSAALPQGHPVPAVAPAPAPVAPVSGGAVDTMADSHSFERQLIKDGKIASLVGEGMVINGDVILERSGIKIDGRVNGNVAVRGDGVLFVGERAVIEGKVIARQLIVAGEIRGGLAAMKCYLMPSAKVAGNMTYGKIKIAEGAEIAGNISKDVEAELDQPEVVSLAQRREAKNQASESPTDQLRA